MSVPPQPSLAVVIPTFNSDAWIVDSVENALVAAQDAADDRRTAIGSSLVLVVDDGSTVPITAGRSGSGRPGGVGAVRVIRCDVNAGQHAATLVGVEAAREVGVDCIVTVDDDLLFGADSLVRLLLAGGWGVDSGTAHTLAYGVVAQRSKIRQTVSSAARALIRWRPEAVATSIRCVPAAWCADLDTRPIDTQLLSSPSVRGGRPVVRVEFNSHGHPLARSRYGIVALLRHAKGYVRSWLGAAA